MIGDAGLQPERTALAWHRTALSLVTVTMAATHVATEKLSAWSAVVGIASMSLALTVFLAVPRRYVRARDPTAGRVDGLLPFAMATFTAVACLAGLAFVLSRGWRIGS